MLHCPHSTEGLTTVGQAFLEAVTQDIRLCQVTALNVYGTGLSFRKNNRTRE